MEARIPDIAFTRNPITFGDRRPGQRLQRFYTVTVGLTHVYTGYYTAPAMVDVSEIAEAYVTGIPSPEGLLVDKTGVIIQLEDPSKFAQRKVSVKDYNGQRWISDFFAIPGGISTQNYRRLKELDTDIFEARLLNKSHNFFFTTRTHGWRIVMDEYEIYPLVFVNLQAEVGKIMIKALGSVYEMSMGDIIQGIYALDVNALRSKFASDYGYLASAFEITYKGTLACQIIIRDTTPDRDCTIVKFRNSLGAFELVHLSGEKESGSNPQESVESGKQYDSVSGRYVNYRGRQSLTRTIEVNTGFKTDDEIQFIMDMVTSSEVYLQDSTGWVRAIPSIEKSTLRSPQIKPESLKVKFTISDGYDTQTPDINDLRDFEVPRIFTDQHSDQFN